MRYGRFRPYTDWPQSSVEIPDGFGVMPRVEALNAQVTRHEAASYSADFFFPAGTPLGATFSSTIAIDQSGDFWCNEIGVQGYQDIGAQHQPNTPPCNLMIRDVRTNRALTYPAGVPALMFERRGSIDAVLDPSFFPIPAGARPTGTLMQSFCFTRSGGIQIDLVLNRAQGGGTSQFFAITFSGWKEYANVSR